MNDRLEIASRLMAATKLPCDVCLRQADALLAEEARTRPPAGDVPVRVPQPGEVYIMPGAPTRRVLCVTNTPGMGDNTVIYSFHFPGDLSIEMGVSAKAWRTWCEDTQPDGWVMAGFLEPRKEEVDAALKQLRVAAHAGDAPAPDAELRAVAEGLYAACEMVEANHNTSTTKAQYAALLARHGWDGKQDTMTFRMTYTLAALRRARALGLGGGQ